MNLKMPIVFDNDCLCSFSWINRLDILDNLFSNNIVIPMIVYNEIRRMLNYKAYKFVFQNIEQKVNTQQYQIKEIPLFSPIAEEYEKLTDISKQNSIGKGEASAIVLAKYLNGTLASNNLRDVLPNIKPDHPPLITTEIILYMSYQQNYINAVQGQNILSKMKATKRKLSTFDFQEVIRKYQGRL
ncbi:hypothetical protein ACAG39_01825 [Caldicellulosiruptoraceae bacterium PP1]